MNLIASLFLKLLTPKDVFTKTYNRFCFWKPYNSQYFNESQKLLKSSGKYLCPTFSLLWAKLRLKKLFLVRSETLWLLVNTLTVDEEYYRHNEENLPLQIQMQLSKKSKIFCCSFFFFFDFLKSTLNEHFEKSETHSLSISKIIDCERRGYRSA